MSDAQTFENESYEASSLSQSALEPEKHFTLHCNTLEDLNNQGHFCIQAEATWLTQD